MKKTLPILGIAILLVGLVITFTACHSKTADSHLPPVTDTTGLAQFQSWKAMNDAQQANEDYVQGYKDAMSTKTTTKTRVIYKPVLAAAPRPVAQPAKKKGWSSAAKGTAIGATTGAIAGALINKKNRLVGGIIGGLIGGGAGYGIGHGVDNKNGR